MAFYEITHETRYVYSGTVSLSRQLVHLQPRVVPWQNIHAHQIVITPAPAKQNTTLDSFGNPILHLEFTQPHESLSVISEMTIEVTERNPHPQESMGWEMVVNHCRYTGGPVNEETLDALRFRQESPFIRIKHVFAEYAATCFTPNKPIKDACLSLMEKIHTEFTFDADATQIATPLQEVLEKKRGVCQDFAHFMLACLRSLGIPARYVSGYLLTTPPPGQPRLIGADASHAWIAVWSPDIGWFDLDPTNNMEPSTEHITLAWGRDFSDISPLKGIILGGGSHNLEVSVTVTPLNNKE